MYSLSSFDALVWNIARVKKASKLTCDWKQND